jgi:hypothetical protein
MENIQFKDFVKKVMKFTKKNQDNGTVPLKLHMLFEIYKMKINSQI